MRLERRHAGEDALVVEMRKALLDRLFNLGTVAMHLFAHLLQYRLREGGGFFDIGVDARVFLAHYNPIISRMYLAEMVPYESIWSCISFNLPLPCLASKSWRILFTSILPT